MDNEKMNGGQSIRYLFSRYTKSIDY